jgi:hypothetical protein
MKMGLQLKVHKLAVWSEHYFNYKELKVILLKNKIRFKKSKLYSNLGKTEAGECKGYFNDEQQVEEQVVVSETRKTRSVKVVEDLQREYNHIALEVLSNEKDFDEFSRKFFIFLNEKANKVEDFYLLIKKEIEDDCEDVSHWIQNNKDRSKWDQENVIIDLKCFKYHAKSESQNANHEPEFNKKLKKFSLKYALVHLYRTVKWLECFCIINTLAVDCVLGKYSEYFEVSCDRRDQLHKSHLRQLEFMKVVEDRRLGIKIVIRKLYADCFTNGSAFKARDEMRMLLMRDHHHTNVFIFALFSIFLLLISAYFIITYYPSIYFIYFPILEVDKIYIDKITVFFPAFNFVLCYIAFLILIPIIMIIFAKYEINYIYLANISPKSLSSPSKYLIVNIKYKILKNRNS